MSKNIKTSAKRNSAKASAPASKLRHEVGRSPTELSVAAGSALSYFSSFVEKDGDNLRFNCECAKSFTLNKMAVEALSKQINRWLSSGTLSPIQEFLPPSCSLEGYEAFFRENPNGVIQFADLGLRGKEKEDYIKYLRSLPDAHPSDLILLDKSDVPASLEGRFEFGRGQGKAGIQP